MLNQLGNDQDQQTLPINETAFCLPEDPVYPEEFLNVMKDTGFQAIQDFLKKIGAPGEVLSLLEDLSILTTWMSDVEKGGQVSPLTNQFLMEVVANASRNIVAIGGVFYSPNGITIRRVIAQHPATPDQESGK